MRLEPKIIPAVMRFLETTIKLRPAEWEPRYNLIPVSVSEIQTTRHAKAPEKAAAEPKKEDPKAKAGVNEPAKKD
jgi:hypothetical protein